MYINNNLSPSFTHSHQQEILNSLSHTNTLSLFHTHTHTQADALLQEEMQVVKTGMGHKELTGAEYGSIWEECYREVVYVPSQSRYTRASLARYTRTLFVVYTVMCIMMYSLVVWCELHTYYGILMLST